MLRTSIYRLRVHKEGILRFNTFEEAANICGRRGRTDPRTEPGTAPREGANNGGIIRRTAASPHVEDLNISPSGAQKGYFEV